MADGQIGGGTGPWALESTLQNIARAMGGQNNLLAKIAAKQGVETKDINRALEKSSADIGGYSAKVGTAVTNMGGALNSGAGLIKGKSSYIGSILEKAGGDLGSAIKTAAAGNKVLSGVVIGGEALVDALGAAASEVGGMAKNVTSLYDTGLVFERGMQDYSLTLSKLGLDTQQLDKIFTKHSGVIATMGVQRFTQLGEAALSASRSFSEIGITTNTGMEEAVANYSETLRYTGRLAQTSNEELIRGTIEYETQLTRITQATGKRREQVEEEIKQLNRRPDINIMYRSVNAETAGNLKKVVEGMSAAVGPASEGLNEMIAGMVIGNRGIAGLTKEQQTILNLAGQTENAQRLQMAAQSGNQEEANRIAREMSKAMGDASPQIAALGEKYRTTAEKMVGFGMAVDSTTDKTAGGAKPTPAPLDKATQDVAEVSRRIETAGNQFDASIMAAAATATKFASDSGALGIVNTGLEKLGTGLNAINKILSGAETTADEKLAAAATATTAVGAVGAGALLYKGLGKLGTRVGGEAAAALAEGTAAVVPEGAGALAKGSKVPPGGYAGRVGLLGTGLLVGGSVAQSMGYDKTGAAMDIAGGGAVGYSLGRMLGPKGGIVGALAGGVLEAYLNKKTLTGGDEAAVSTTTTSPSTTTSAAQQQAQSSMSNMDVEVAILEQLTILNSEVSDLLEATRDQTRRINDAIDRNSNIVN